MPRPIANIGAGNPATYTLSGNEEFTVLAVTFSLVALAGAGGDKYTYLDMRDPSGGIIHLQPLAASDGANMFFSLAVGASEFLASISNAQVPPPWSSDASYSYVVQELAPLTLYSGCTINAYKTVGSDAPPDDPITRVSADYTIPDLHLWVQDTGGKRVLEPDLPPLLTHVQTET